LRRVVSGCDRPQLTTEARPAETRQKKGTGEFRDGRAGTEKARTAKRALWQRGRHTRRHPQRRKGKQMETTEIKIPVYIYTKLCALKPTENPISVLNSMVLTADEKKQLKEYETIPVECSVCKKWKQYGDCVPIEKFYSALMSEQGKKTMPGICRKCAESNPLC
jgi:hypothetical protein